MNYAERGFLLDVRRALLHLHKTLLEWERVAYERIHGRVGGHELLHAILTNPQFAWLRPLSALIVRIDETLEQQVPETAADVAAILDRARALVPPDEAAGQYAQRYNAALQESPDAVLAHRDVAALLKRGFDAALPSQRPH